MKGEQKRFEYLMGSEADGVERSGWIEMCFCDGDLWQHLITHFTVIFFSPAMKTDLPLIKQIVPLNKRDILTEIFFDVSLYFI